MTKASKALATMLLAAAAPSSAAILTTVYTGIILNGIDNFGTTGTDLTNADYKAVFAFDTSNPLAVIGNDGDTGYIRGNSPVVKATFTDGFAPAKAP